MYRQFSHFMSLWARYLLLGAATCGFAMASAADPVRFTVTDLAGNPVANAVVSVAINAQPESASSPPSMATVDQQGKRFVPRVSVIRAGQYVQFPNSDDIRHHVYSFSAAKSFEIRLYRGKPAEPLLFDKPGIVSLGCNIHDRMRGFIYVHDDQEIVGMTDSAGQVLLNSAAGGAVHVWHEQLQDPSRRLRVEAQPSASSPTGQLIEIELRPVNPTPSNSFRKRFDGS